MTAASVSESFIRKELAIEALYNDRDLFGLRATGLPFYDCELHIIGVRGLVMNTAAWGVQSKGSSAQIGPKRGVDKDKGGGPFSPKQTKALSPTRKKSVRGVGKEGAGAGGGGGGSGSPTKKTPAPPAAVEAMSNASSVIAVLYLDGEEVGKTGVCSSEHPDAADPLWLWESEVFYLRIPCAMLSDRYAPHIPPRFLIHSHPHAPSHTHTLTRPRTYPHILTLIHSHSHTHALSHTHTLTPSHIHIHSRPLTYPHPHALSHIHTHTHTHTSSDSFSQPTDTVSRHHFHQITPLFYSPHNISPLSPIALTLARSS